MTKTDFDFPIFDSLKRGLLSLWLNRLALLPLTTLPLGVTFITLTLIRTYAPDDASQFAQAMMQVPADFAIGLFCSLIVLIIMSAPRKNKKDTVVFTLNVTSKKRLLIAGAIAHTLFGYLFMGGFALIDMVGEPMRQINAQNPTIIRWDLMLLVIAMFVATLYLIRFALLPILVVAEMDVKNFFRTYPQFKLSFPIIFIKLGTMMAAALVLLSPVFLLVPQGDVELNVIQTLLVDICASLTTVAYHAWGYAALAIGLRSMLDK